MEYINIVCEKLDYYTNSEKIYEFLKNKELRDYEITESLIIEVAKQFNYGMKNRCLQCNIDMGINNPRQLCGKYYCRRYW
jgi:hypothetical protein